MRNVRTSFLLGYSTISHIKNARNTCAKSTLYLPMHVPVEGCFLESGRHKTTFTLARVYD
ncbi:hypothetical protein WN55_08015 [Dufourea novaeangliae]|uniref:Uncharacterized protein n=1 Tax=Dufourea novaeangliae TaxID=178035 RepID=A0A154P6Y3_DUFNO|nr:hypothetical protein WN55_08015 [Dufourea novaeangliae]